MEGLQTIVTDSNDQMVVELRALTKEMSDSTLQVTDLVKGSSQSQLKSINLEIKKQISGVGSKTSEEISSLRSKIKNTDSETLRKLSLNQAAILSTLQAVSSQNDDIKKRFEEQQDKISFPLIYSKKMAEETLENITENENYNTLNEINADENP